MRAACRRNPLIRVQAARHLAGTGQSGWRAVQGFIRKNGVERLSAELVLALGELGSEEALEWLRKVHEQANFPWPPQALRALALASEQGSKRDIRLFQRKLRDPSASIRLAALLGLERTRGQASVPLLRRSLGDPSPLVRIGAARLLLGRGDPTGLPVLVESLNLEDPVLDLDLAAAPRMEARRVLRSYLRDPRRGTLPHDPEAFAALAERRARQLLRRDYRLPALARARTSHPRFVFLFERRSCRAGDLILRVDAQGSVWRGEAPPKRLPGLDGNKLLQIFRELRATQLGKASKIRCDSIRVAWDRGQRIRRAPEDFPPSWRPLFDLLRSWEEAGRKK